jgi:hypothetical protein
LQIYFNGPSIHGEKQTNPVKISFRLPSPLNPNFDRPKLNGRIVLAVFTQKNLLSLEIFSNNIIIYFLNIKVALRLNLVDENI